MHKNSPITPPELQSGDNNNKKDPNLGNHHDDKPPHETTDKLTDLYNRYADENDRNMIGVEGITLLCEDLSLDPTDFAVLVIAWRFSASVQCQFTR